jgi:hypothetical protein
MRAIRRRLTFANVVSCIALFVALGGAAYAAGKLSKNSVGTKQIKNQAVTAAKIKKGAITGAQVANGSLTGTQINLSTLGAVPSATKATTATIASTSENAQTLDGQSADQLTNATKLHCSTGMELAGGVCFEGSAREPEEWFNAVFACAERKLRLPTAGELIMFERRLKSEPAQEWTEPQFPSGVAQLVAADESGLAIGFESTSVKEPYRCVTLASN